MIRCSFFRPPIAVFAALAAMAGLPSPAAPAVEDGAAAMPAIVAVMPRLFPPLYHLDDKGRPTGFAVEAMERIARIAGRKVTFRVEKGWKEVHAAMAAGAADVIPISGIRAPLDTMYQHTAPVLTYPISIFVRRGMAGVGGIEDLGGRRIVTIAASAAAPILARRRDVALVFGNDLHGAIFELLAGRVDALAFSEPLVWKALREMGIGDRLRAVGRPLAEVKLAVAIGAGRGALRDDLDAAVAKFVASPAYQALFERWFGRPRPFWTPARIVLSMSALLVLLVAAGGAWRYRSLARLNRKLAETAAERGRMRESLEESERAYATLLSNLPGVVYRYRKEQDWTVAFVSEGAYELTGYRPDQLIGEKVASLADIVVPEDRHRVRDEIQRALSENRPYRVVYRIATAAGRGKWVVAHGRGARGEDGELVFHEGFVIDVTDHRQAVAALRESEQRHRTVIGALDEGIILRDADGKLLASNPSAEKILGQPLETALREFGQFGVFHEDGSPFPPDDIPAAGVLRSGQPRLDVVMGIGRPDGEVTWLLVNAVPVRLDGQERLRAVVTSFKDITAQRHAEMALREREAGVRAVMDHAADGIITTDEKGIIETFNEAAERIFGYAADEAVGKNVGLLMGADAAGAHDDSIRNYLETGTSKVVGIGPRPLAGRRKDGSGISIEIAISDINLGGKRRFIGTIRDITERQRGEAALRDSEARFRLLVDQATDAIFLNDRQGVIVDVNRAACESLGYERDELIGNSADDIVVLEDGRRVKDLPRRLVAGASVSIECAHRRKDGSLFPVDVRLAAFESGGRKLILALARDVTERKAAEQQLRQVQKMEAVGRLTGGMAHDFNNLLAVIMGNLELLQERLPPQDRNAKLVDAATGAVVRGAKLTRRLLAFSRRQALQPRAIGLRSLVEDMDTALAQTAGENVAVEIDIPAGLWDVLADPDQFESAILNLVENAREAMPHGGVVRMEAANTPVDRDTPGVGPEVRPGAYVMLSVSDTGGGIKSALLEHVVEPFFTTKEMSRGTGLGLSMVYGFVRQSGGQVAIESEEGSGTRVRLFLPRAAAEAAGAGAGAVHGARDPGAETILVVEDDDAVRAVAIRQLTQLGYRVIEADSGARALDLIDRQPDVALLFTDIVMPGGMDGWELAREARRRLPHIRVLFASGYAQDYAIGAGRLDAGATLLQKPYRKNELSRRIQAALAADGP